MLLWSLVFFGYAYPAHTGLVPSSLWNGLIYRLQDKLRHARSDETFRGTLIDPRLERALARHKPALALHGHAHHSSFSGESPSGVRVCNVALPLLRQRREPHPFTIFTI